MEFYLIKDQIVRFVGMSSMDTHKNLRISDFFPVILEPVDSECEDSKEYCKFIGSLATPGFSDQCNFQLGHTWQAHLTIPSSTSGLGKLDLYHCSLPENGTTIYDVLLSQFTKENLIFHLSIKDLKIQYSCKCKTQVNLEFKDCSVLFKDIKFPKHELHPTAIMKGWLITKIRLTVIVKLNNAALERIPLKRLPLENPRAKNKRMLDEAVGSDLVVVVANGAEVKCHKCFLMVSSDAFRAMFENKMKEGTTNRLELTDMSEVGVQAFLNFIYTSDLEAASEKCDIALELFRAGDKYGMAVLKRRMKTLICSKPIEWFNVDMALRLSLLVLNMEEKEEIFKKMAEVLKWYSTNSPEELLTSEDYEELLRTHPQVGMKLFTLFLKST